MKLTLGFSPCPNDTFIFDALIHQKIDTHGLAFEVGYHDVETLNQYAFSHTLDITKLSYHAFAHVRDAYELLDAGSALGFGVGPLLIAGDPVLAMDLAACAGRELPPDLARLRVGIPGRYTTANFLLGLAYPQLQNKISMVFSDIEQAVSAGTVDLGLIIHENRFTYQQHGLFKVQDLGDYWKNNTGGYPIPLGGIAIRRALPDAVKQQVNRLVAESVGYAFDNPASGMAYIRQHAQEMDESVMRKHIDLYVNAYSQNLGSAGRAAVTYMLEEAERLHLVPLGAEKPIFLTHPEVKQAE